MQKARTTIRRRSTAVPGALGDVSGSRSLQALETVMTYERDPTPRARALAAYVQRIQTDMRLSEYRIYTRDHPEDVESEDGGTTNVALCEFAEHGSLDAWITVRPYFWETSPADQRDTIVHELLHVMAHEWQRVGEQFAYSGHMPTFVAGMMQTLLQHEQEAIVTRLAHLFADRFPLPTEIGLDVWDSGERGTYVEHG